MTPKQRKRLFTLSINLAQCEDRLKTMEIEGSTYQDDYNDDLWLRERHDLTVKIERLKKQLPGRDE